MCRSLVQEQALLSISNAVADVCVHSPPLLLGSTNKGEWPKAIVAAAAGHAS